MSKYLVEFVQKRSMIIEADGITRAMEEAVTWVNHGEVPKGGNLKDLGFTITGIREVDAEGMEYGPARD